MGVVFSVVIVVLLFGALADIITIDESRVKHLPRMWWIIIVILMPLIGSALWFIVGRQYAGIQHRASTADTHRQRMVPVDSAPSSDFAVRDTAAELAALEREIAAHEREERISELEAELKAKREARRRGRPDSQGA